ncbi:MlaA family lipoprotein [Pseudoroseicyclus tamaricis]|uniref:VacJ family lipoprotein n=1 Tax=Pseudoroseicyclus tamaricis TaxID=2705421 RepID=A0A6B2JXA9_9RHOB|nr:VacJ family lipoprotein [Pseudoroseicyclus tamaricis]NDV02868.1 VacJ family lipoprotein [Pseudoroseicyclus tamaricis]
MRARSLARPAALVPAALLALAACTPAPPGTQVHDPYEARNRAVHAFNIKADTVALRPLGQAANAVVPEGIGAAIVTFSDNASLPGMALNGLLQGNIEDAAVNSGRFVFNTLFGFLGFGDPAAEIGLYERDTDFGETLAVWGAPEGAYLELPLLGPSTERDAAGELVDILLDPLEWVGSDAVEAYRRYGTAAYVGEQIVERGQFMGTVDGLLYESADSYAQARLAYLQNRRFQLGPASGAGGGAAQADGFVDPFADEGAAAPAADAYPDFVDPFADLE